MYENIQIVRQVQTASSIITIGHVCRNQIFWTFNAQNSVNVKNVVWTQFYHVDPSQWSCRQPAHLPPHSWPLNKLVLIFNLLQVTLVAFLGFLCIKTFTGSPLPSINFIQILRVSRRQMCRRDNTFPRIPAGPQQAGLNFIPTHRIGMGRDEKLSGPEEREPTNRTKRK